MSHNSKIKEPGRSVISPIIIILAMIFSSGGCNQRNEEIVPGSELLFTEEMLGEYQFTFTAGARPVYLLIAFIPGSNKMLTTETMSVNADGYQSFTSINSFTVDSADNNFKYITTEYDWGYGSLVFSRQEKTWLFQNSYDISLSVKGEKVTILPAYTMTNAQAIIIRPRSYFYQSPGGKRMKAYLVQNDKITALVEYEGYYYIEFTGPTNKITKGWIKKEDTVLLR